MSIRCDICGEWSPGTGVGHRDICLPCFERNFSGNLLEETSAREALEVYVDAQGPYQLTPRQAEAMARMREAWRRQEDV